MPELPEVETTLRGISPHLLHKKITQLIVRQSQLRWPITPCLAEIIVGKKIRSISRRGKYLLLSIAEGHLLIHLGMSGSLRIVPSNEPALFHDHIDLQFGKLCLRYADPRRFGCWLWIEGNPEEHKLFKKLGPEPLTENFHADYLWQKSRGRSKTLKEFIMDNHIVVGVGNIYANESLFMAGIKPIRKASTLTKKEAELWVEKIRFVLQRSIDQGGTTLRDFVGGDGKPGYFQQQLLVYGRGGLACINCTKPLKEIRLGGRSSVYCVDCQQ
ncbi:MAG: bifunctional DNA-formamidopyrimidine glycosylase/DNA-(apurinic or apyrimidinic site) lyase [Cellvibrio sp.]|nr:bifunctional DNA-formamidopyrimidine glycosylase/DNA-(apurinic or apyrimidinic site) lyase [Cellvibrio sp.]